MSAAARPPGISRRWFLGSVVLAAAGVTATTAGQTVPVLRGVDVLAARTPGRGTGLQRVPVNRVLVLLALAHDLVLVPVVFGVAAVLRRLVPGPARRYLASGLALSGVALAVAWPGLRGYGRLPDNATVLPSDYAAGLRTVLVVLWLALLAVFVVRTLLDELRAPGTPPAAGTPEPAPASAVPVPPPSDRHA